MNSTSSAAQATRVALEPRQAVSVTVEPGTAIEATSGRIWLTQEGDARDHCIPAGVTFCTDRGGKAVLSAVGGPAEVVVRAAAGCAPGTARITSFERIVRAAREARGRYLGGLLARLVGSS
ncbi:MAG TPA: DUF2917 domain-containing protein [Burkholderiales bacterium]|nr:DUF2917 domain-containing protein [Burkholderiales bacterium]